MDNKKVAEIIGCHERTVRRMSPRKRRQWQALAAKGRTMAWFDILSQLMFEVEAFNSGNGGSEWLWLQLSGVPCSVTHYKDYEQQFHKDVYNIDQLTEALCYVYGLSK